MKKGKLKLLVALLLIGLTPLLIASVSLTISTVNKVKNSTEEATYKKLKIASENLKKYYIRELEDNEEIPYEHDYIDSLLDENIELTLFLEDTRYITSIKGSDGNRNEGTTADPEIYKQVCSGKDYSAKNVKIGEKKYYVYYVPLTDSDGNVIGMAFSGEPETTVQSQIRKATQSSVIIGVTIAIICAFLVIIVAISIRKRIVSVIEVADTLASGQVNVDINMSSSILEIETLIAAVSKLQQQLQSVISGVLQDVGNLDTNMINITNKVNGCNQAAEGIASAIDEITKGTLDMAESVQNTAVEMNEIGQNITEINSLANDASVASDMVKKESNEAKRQLSELIQANSDTVQISDDVVDGINSSAQAIQNIRQAADMIAQITSQTSLLALNASIEAARAGEQGRGFAVVASEISNLATQSDESTKEIMKVVSEIIDASEQNIILANKIKSAVNNEGSVLSHVCDSFDIVDDKITQSSDAITEITKKAQFLDEAKVKILDEINTLSSISEEDAASCEETNANMEEFSANMEDINQQAQDTQNTSTQLKESVSYFQL